ncbi:MAG: polyphosphate kinase 1, partial [Bacteroidia bacterium]
DWMVRNIDHRVEVTCPITNSKLKKELIDILNIQLKDNVKARILDNSLSNNYEKNAEKPFISQIETYQYLKNKTNSL